MIDDGDLVLFDLSKDIEERKDQAIFRPDLGDTTPGTYSELGKRCGRRSEETEPTTNDPVALRRVPECFSRGGS